MASFCSYCSVFLPQGTSFKWQGPACFSKPIRNPSSHILWLILQLFQLFKFLPTFQASELDMGWGSQRVLHRLELSWISSDLHLLHRQALSSFCSSKGSCASLSASCHLPFHLACLHSSFVSNWMFPSHGSLCPPRLAALLNCLLLINRNHCE